MTTQAIATEAYEQAGAGIVLLLVGGLIVVWLRRKARAAFRIVQEDTGQYEQRWQQELDSQGEKMRADLRKLRGLVASSYEKGSGSGVVLQPEFREGTEEMPIAVQRFTAAFLFAQAWSQNLPMQSWCAKIAK